MDHQIMSLSTLIINLVLLLDIDKIIYDLEPNREDSKYKHNIEYS